MATIKIKFKDGFNLSTSVDVSINFVCSGIPYQRIQVSNNLLRYQDISGDWVTCCNEVGWTNNKYKIIEIDDTQPNFQTFINAMKSNIEGVLLESGTYVWNNEQPFWGGDFPTSAQTKIIKFNFTSNNIQFASCGVSVYGAGEFHFAYGKSTATTTSDTYLNSDVSSGKVVEVCNTEAYDLWGGTDLYRTIILDTDQYVDYDFYSNYVGSKLNKQATEITYTCKWYLDGTIVNTSTFTHEQLTGVDYNVLGSVFKVMLSASLLAQYDYGVNLNGETSNASLGSDNVITIEAFKSNIVFNITSNGTTTLATKNTYVPCDIDFNVNVPSVQLQEKSEYITSNTQTIITPDTGKALSKVTITTDVPQMTEVATSAEMDAKLNENNVSLYYKYTGTTDDKYTNGDIYQVQEG